MHWSFVSDLFYIDSFDRLSISSFTSKLTGLAVGVLLVLPCARAFSAIFRVVWKKLAFFPIREIVIPVAGLGTRALPAAKAIPKGLLPVYDRPFIEHVIKEAIAVGNTEIILVIRSGKEAI